MRFLFLFGIILMVSCHSETSDRTVSINSNSPNTAKDSLTKPTFLDTVKQIIIANNKNYEDTASYSFVLEGSFSAEGNEGEAIYQAGKIKKIDITFFGEMGKSTSSYTFDTQSIKVEQKTFNYESTLSGKVKSTETVSYGINYKGELIAGDSVGADTDTFLALKQSIPFTLK